MARDHDPQRLLDALSSPIRREILWLVRDRELPAGEIAAAFELTAPTISQHLTVLRDSGLVDMRVDGTFRRYRARPEKLRGVEALLADDDRWLPASNIPETQLTAAAVESVVRVSVEAHADVHRVFRCFTDAAEYSRFMGVPVTIDDGRFACTLEWGTRARGTYDVVAEPSLIAMRWDFEDDNIPVPGDERVAYLRIDPTKSGSHVEVHQLVVDEREAAFMSSAWGMVLGRLQHSFVDRAPARRRARAKLAPRPSAPGPVR